MSSAEKPLYISIHDEDSSGSHVGRSSSPPASPSRGAASWPKNAGGSTSPLGFVCSRWTRILLALMIAFMVFLLFVQQNSLDFNNNNYNVSPDGNAGNPNDGGSGGDNNNGGEKKKESKPFYFPPLRQPPPPPAVKKPRIFDIITFNDELSVLDIRLNELNDVVDVFVVIEAAWTFSGHTKPLTYKANEALFAKFRHKIIHVVLPPITKEELETNSPQMGQSWTMEKYTRDMGLSMGLDIYKPDEGDWIILSDLDEIPRPKILQAMKDQDVKTEYGALFAERNRSPKKSGGDIFRFECKFYYYSYEFHHLNGDWVGPVVVRYREANSPVFTSSDKAQEGQNGLLRKLATENWRYAGGQMRAARYDNNAVWVPNAGWHCTWCFSTISAVLSKVEAYSHLEHNQAQFKTRKWILNQFSKGLDLFDRQSEKYEHITNNQDLPAYVKANQEKFSYMLHRWEKPDAGFTDVDPRNPLLEEDKKEQLPDGA
ncbi:MAG: glycosyltransferase family 17-domain-containing protein [Benniella sp.]|nr:MAG: glycosyltransferase family 17-domain-containing protein [Benniella sp.]